MRAWTYKLPVCTAKIKLIMDISCHIQDRFAIPLYSDKIWLFSHLIPTEI